ncbi:MAG: hypothetical protein AMK75_02085 [Planctomycetes bacterium SM23_65]|nr:MAG: hypothetical protein AMK75_02085 [Planctomycetes bacterium SM23_65]
MGASETGAVHRVVYIVPALDHVCVRHRVDVFVPALQRRGWIVEKWVLPRGLLKRLRLFWRLRRADVVVVVRKLLRRGQLGFLRWCSRRLVFDFDDAVVYRDSSRAKQLSRGRAGRFRRMMRASDRAIAGNAYLARLVAGHGGRASTIPTCVDVGRLSPAATKRAGGKVVIGWIGSHSTLMYLEPLHRVFEELARRYGHSVVLKVVCDKFPEAMGLEVIEKPWALDDELADLRTFDIGIMPLPDDAWTRGKCGFKLLQYMAVGIPVVASSVGVNVEIVRDGENGFLANDDARWVEVLSDLIEDVELRHRIGRQGWASLHGRYTVADWAGRYVQVIEEVAGLRAEVPES